MKICVVSLRSMSVHVDIPGSPRGGAEIQAGLLVESLAVRGHQISVVLTDYDETMRATPRLTPLPLINAYNHRDGLPGLRFLYPRWVGMYRALAEADADAYLQMCEGAATGQVAHFCRRRNRGFVFATASDTDVDPALLRLKRRDRCLYEYGIRRADRRVTQHRGQAEELRRHYGLDSTPIAMATRLPERVGEPDPHPIVLWLGTIRAVKQPERYLAVAREVPEARFVMVGGRAPGNEAVFDRVRDEASGIANVDFRGGVPDVEPFLSRAWVLLNTSDSEGFPTAFLEAWARRVPTVSMFDPGGLVGEQGFGVIAREVQNLPGALRSVLESRERRDAMGGKAREYVLREHSPEVVAERFERELLAAARARGRV